MQSIAESELILNPDGSMYHLHLHPEELANTIITVGDPDRVNQVSKHFDKIECKKQNREYMTHTGYLGKKRISVISTGIGVNSIDIVINELDALANIDFKTRQAKPNLTSLDIIRIGTSGTFQADIKIDSFLAAEYCLGFDALLNFYQQKNSADELNLLSAFVKHMPDFLEFCKPYITKGSEYLLEKFSPFAQKGITATCEGFYAPQGRVLRLPLAYTNFIAKLQGFQHNGKRLTNFEMETSAIYGLGQALGHRCLSLNAIIANRALGEFSKDYKSVVTSLIEKTLETLTNEN